MLIQYVDSLRSLEAIRHAMPRLEAAAIPFPFLLPSPLRGRRAGDEGAERDQRSCDEMRRVETLSPSAPSSCCKSAVAESGAWGRGISCCRARWLLACASRDAQASGWKRNVHRNVCPSSTSELRFSATIADRGTSSPLHPPFCPGGR